MRTSQPLSQAIRAGLVIGGYQLLFRLGKGGMGEVWAAAKHLTDLNLPKLMALKLLSAEQVGSNSALRFFDEAKAASALQHTAIVNTTDLGRDGDFLFIAMDLVRGPALAGLMQRLVAESVMIPPALVAHIGIQIASALDYAHDRAIVNGKPLKLIHRDVSPQNVLIDATGSVRLTDFGIARTTSQEHKSFVGAVAGKPSYMSPEQVNGGELDARSDQFSLGIMLHEASCLQRLFGRSNPTASMTAVLRHDPQPLVDLVPGFPKELDQVISRSLAKDREQRFENAAEMVKALSEASRKLSMATVGRDLAALVNQMFPDATENFDRQAAITLQAAGVSHEHTVTVIRQVAPDARLATMTAPPIGNDSAEEDAPEEFWPTRVGADALAPEVAETRAVEVFAAPTFSSVTSGPRLKPPPAENVPKHVVALAAVSAIAIAAVSAVVVVGRGPAAGPIPAVLPPTITGSAGSARGPTIDSPTENPTASPSVEATSGVTAEADEIDDPEPAVVTDQTSPTPTVPSALSVPSAKSLPAKRLPRTAAVSNPTTEPRPASVATAPKKEREPVPPPTASTDATPNDVFALIKQLKRKNPEEGNRLLVKYSEASKDDTKILNALRDEALEKLSH